MCGGRGTRLDADVEKPLVRVGDVAMVDRVLGALSASAIDDVYAVVSPHVPDTRAHLVDREYRDAPGGARIVDSPRECIDAPGEGYVADLRHALDRVDTPVLTVAADLPLLAADAVDSVLDVHETGALTVCVPAALKRRLGLSVDAAYDAGDAPDDDGLEPRPTHLAPTGLNVVADAPTDTMHLTYDARLAVNVNRPQDVRIAEALLCE